MKNARLEHHSYPPFQHALRVYDAVLQLATTDRRRINERLLDDADRLLRHVGCAAIEKKRPARCQRLHYGRLALTMLAITVDAAERASLITSEQAEEARHLMVDLEREVIAGSGEQAAKAPAPTEVVDEQHSEVSSTSNELPPDTLAELRELIDRDRPPLETRDPCTDAGIAPAGNTRGGGGPGG